jgi:hypothetical protein|tara:strand:+ start:1010 stop:1138 length:129 start_codon:yes stop_codon:yes gene_type:complete
MIPRDWILIKQGYDAQARANARGAGSNAPSVDDVRELARMYG